MTALPSGPMKLANLAGRRIVIWGYGTEGKAAARLLLRHAPPAELTFVVDAAEPPAADASLADVAVRSAHT